MQDEKPSGHQPVTNNAIYVNSRVALSSGKFPDFLLDTWDDFDFRKKSDNDRPGNKWDSLYNLFLS